MSQNVSRYLVLAVLVVVSLGGCASKTPVEQALESRAAYKATLNSFFVKETPLAEMPAAVEEEAEAGAASDAEAPEGEQPVEVPIPTRRDAMLDIIVQHDSRDPLAGLTLDITMVDGGENEVGHWKLWVDTEGLPKANQRTVTHVLEGVDYEEGYGFNVEVRQGIPPSEYGDYRELAGI